jgi:hypothetical protein
VRLGPGDDECAVTAGQLWEVFARLEAAGHWAEGDPPVLVAMDAGYNVTRLAWLLASWHGPAVTQEGETRLGPVTVTAWARVHQAVSRRTGGFEDCGCGPRPGRRRCRGPLRPQNMQPVSWGGRNGGGQRWASDRAAVGIAPDIR